MALVSHDDADSFCIKPVFLKLKTGNEMIVIWKGWGLLVLVIALVVSLATMMLLATLGVAHGFGPALGAILSAVAIWVVGNKLNSPLKNRVLVDQNTGAKSS